MARLGDIYGGGGTFLKAEDIKGKGDVNVVIESVSYDEYDGKKRAVLHFRGKEKVLPLNVTNANMVADLLHSEEMDDWEGQRICLYVTKVPFQGKPVDAIRVKEARNGTAAAPKPKPEPVSQELDVDDVGF